MEKKLHGLTEYMIENNLTNKELAEKLGLTAPYLSLIRHGKHPGSVSLVRRAARILKKDPNVLFPDFKEVRRRAYARKENKNKPSGS